MRKFPLLTLALAALLFLAPRTGATDVVVTASKIAKSGGGVTAIANAGVAITAGQVLYQDTAGLLWPAICSSTAVKSVVVGVALSSAPGVGQPVVYLPSGGTLNFGGAVLVSGQTYVLSATSGNIAPIGDLMTGNYVTLLGVASSTSLLPLNVNATQLTSP
jgi:hypothetical protein